jgi:Ni,Fe-hydrogenase III large subunit
MKIFDSIINKTTFTFIRVTYGRGDLWYHISYQKDDKVITFRMSKCENSNWNLVDIKDNWLHEFTEDFNAAVNSFETSLLAGENNLEIQQL